MANRRVVADRIRCMMLEDRLSFTSTMRTCGRGGKAESNYENPFAKHPQQTLFFPVGYLDGKPASGLQLSPLQTGPRLRSQAEPQGRTACSKIRRCAVG